MLLLIIQKFHVKQRRTFRDSDINRNRYLFCQRDIDLLFVLPPAEQGPEG